MSSPAFQEADGLYADHQIQKLLQVGAIFSETPVTSDQVQPASLDLRLGSRLWRLRASFLPNPHRRVSECISFLNGHEISFYQGAALEPGAIYVAEILENLSLPSNVEALANPKSSIGRLDVFTRLISDYTTAFDQIKPGYGGPIFAEIAPRTFPIFVRPGSRLAQLRFRQERNKGAQEGEASLFREAPIINIRVDLSGFDADGLVGYRARRYTDLIEMDRVGAYCVREFWEPIYLSGYAHLILDPGEFYILASKEAVCVPPNFAAQMTPFDALMGEFRVHYAGFFDPGFGGNNTQQSRAVLEVRSRDVPFILEDGQIVGKLIYEKMSHPPHRLYGQDLQSHYQGQGLKLSKHFK